MGSMVSNIFSAVMGHAAVAAATTQAPGSQPAAQAAQADAKPSGTGAKAVGAGNADTLLTGLGGVDPKSLNLGKSTLLGE